MGLIILLRWPLEIAAFLLAFAPALDVLLAWPDVQSGVPVHFGYNGRPDRWASRQWLWLLPGFAVAVYALMGEASGTWAWAFFGRLDLPAGAEIPLVLKPVVGLLILYANRFFVRIVRDRAEVPNVWAISGLMLLLAASPIAVTAVAL